MALTIVKSNATIPTVPNDDFVESNVNLFSVYQNLSFSFDLTFTLEGIVDGLLTLIPILSIESVFGTYNSVTFTVINDDPYAYKIRVNGLITDVLGIENYTFLLEDLTIITIPVTNYTDYLGLIAWFLPPTFSALISTYTFDITVGDPVPLQEPIPPGDLFVTMNQYVYWNYNVAIPIFRATIAGGI